MDILHDILTTLDLKGALYFRTDFSPPWAVTVPDYNQAARFHLVAQGTCHVRLPDGAAADLGPGDLILIPGGRSHVLADAPGAEAPPLETVLQDAGYDGSGVLIAGGGRGGSTQMVCGHFSFRPGADHPILRALPDFVIVRAAQRLRYPILDDVLRLIARRIFAEGMGSTAAVTRLSEIVYIEILQSGVVTEGGLPRVLAALRDRQIGEAITLMHRRPGEAWTVSRLAAAVGMSRSRFADRFRELMDLGPMTYLADWRLQKALALLEDDRRTVQQVAAETGYLSAAAFTRAFAGRFGVPPTTFRRKAA